MTSSCRTALVVTLLLASSCSTASARTVGYHNIVSPTKLISCYAVMSSPEVQCMASYLPDIGEFDTFLGLKARGRAVLAERSDFPGFATRRRTLRYGDTWKRPGIRCTMRTSGLTCRNKDGHGFHIAKGDVRRF